MSGQFDLNAMPDFEASVANLNAERSKQEEESQFFDDRVLYFKSGHNYLVALCWPVSPTGQRNSPFILRVTHADIGPGRTGREVTCPTSAYIYGKAGFRHCKACDEVNRYYNDFKKNQSATSEELYRHFKRQYRYYALVYVISDDNNPDNNGKFMLMRLPLRVSDYLHRKIFGWAMKKDETPLPTGAVIGTNAFKTDGSWNVLITVSTETTAEGTYNSYATEFSPRSSPLPFTQADVNKAGIDLKYDEDFYVPFNPEEVSSFVTDVMLQANLDSEGMGGSGGTFNPADLSNFDPNKTVQAQPKTAQATQTAAAPQQNTASAAPANTAQAAPANADANAQPKTAQAAPAVQNGSSGSIDDILAEVANLGKLGK
jgi:hypothetical protein